MRLGFPKVLVLLGAGLIAASTAAAAPSPSTCHPTALVTTDNDIRLKHDDRPPGKPIAIPPTVAGRLHAAAATSLSQVDVQVTDGLTCAALFPSIYRLTAPEQRDLYVADISVGSGVEFFYLIVYDPTSGAVTRDPPRIAAKWSQSFGAADQLVTRPFVSAFDLFQDRHREIVFEERVYNGTAYNAVVYHYFRVGPKLELTPVLAVEARVVALKPPDKIFVREFAQLTPTRLRLSLLGVPRDPAAHARPLGYVILESPSAGLPFHVTERHSGDVIPSEALVTFNEKPPGDDIFLREGYSFRY
jgi:hypothetical protein